MARFWCSWIQSGSDIRPYSFPPPESILGWWQSGEKADGSAIICAVVVAMTDSAAMEAITQKTAWPDAGDFRFIERKESDFVPGDRFPLSVWMQPRFAKGAVDNA